MAVLPHLSRVAVIVLCASCAGRPYPTTPITRDRPPPAACAAGRAPVTWVTLDGPRHRPVLDRWCVGVGAPVVLSGAPRAGRDVVIVSWNMRGRSGRLDDLVASPPLARRRADTGVVVLLQEAVRTGPEVPRVVPPDVPAPGPLPGDGATPDIVETARRLGWSLAYVPSMRNGRHAVDAGAEDRGNAILSSVPLTDISAIELPIGRQRRVAVAATLLLGEGRAPLRVVSFHLDTWGGRAAQAHALAGYLAEETGRGVPIVAGGDLNSLFGRRDAAHRALASALPEADCGDGRTNTWPWRLHTWLGWWRGRLDFIFTDAEAARAARACLTEARFFGSDHLPVRLDLVRRAPASLPP